MYSHAEYSTVAQAWREHMTQCRCPAHLHWKAESFRGTFGQPMTVRRAKALNAVLEGCRLHVVPGELLAGIGNLGRSLPNDAFPAEVINADRDYINGQIGARNFTTHSDHHAPDYPELLRLGFGGIKQRVRESIGSRRCFRPHAALERVSETARRARFPVFQFARTSG